MPEYSSTTITPADGVQVPSMNGSTSGNFLLSALRDYILASKGQANGLASLGSDGKLTPSQLPDLADDVIVVASYAVLPATGTAGKIYITADNNKMYRWDSDLSTPDYVELSVDLSEYAKLTDLAAEESARETADANLNDAIAQHEARIENLEEAHGSYHEVDVKSVYTIPSGKGSNWLIDGLRGVSRVENNLLKTKNDSANGITITPSTGNKVVINGTATADITQTTYFCGITNLDIQANRVVLLGGFSNAKIALKWIGQGYVGGFHDVASTPQVITATSGMFRFSMVIASGTSFDNEEIELPFITDLNVYFNTSDLSFLGATDSAKLASIQTNYPWLLTPSDYGTSGVNTVYEGVRSKARNLWDEEWDNGTIDSSGNNASGTTVRSKNYIPVVPSRTYYFLTPIEKVIAIAEYDADKNFIKFVYANRDSKTVENNCFYIRFYVLGTGYTSYANDICINQSDSQNGTYTPYKPPVTLTFPSPVSLKSAGAVAEEAYLNEDGEAWKTNPLGSYTFDGTEGWSADSGYYRTNVVDNIIAQPENSTTLPNIFIVGFIPTEWQTTADKAIYIIPQGVGSNNKIWFRDTNGGTKEAFAQSMIGKTITFELATPSADTPLTPILNNLIPTEAGGTIESILTTPVDDSMTLGYINL